MYGQPYKVKKATFLEQNMRHCQFLLGVLKALSQGGAQLERVLRWHRDNKRNLMLRTLDIQLTSSCPRPMFLNRLVIVILEHLGVTNGGLDFSSR